MPIPGLDLSTASAYHDNYQSVAGVRVNDAGEPDPDGRNIRNYLGPTRKAVTLGYNREVGLYKARFWTVPQIMAKLGWTAQSHPASILWVGAGFGWEVEAAQSLMPNATHAALDDGPWIQSVKDQDESADIAAAVAAVGITGQEAVDIKAALNNGARSRVPIEGEDLTRAQGRNRLRNAYNGSNSANFIWGISVDVAPWLTDAEMISLDAAGHQCCDNVCHLTSLYQPALDGFLEPDPVWNWKYLGPVDDLGWNKINPVPAWYTETNWATLLPNSHIIGYRADSVLHYDPGA